MRAYTRNQWIDKAAIFYAKYSRVGFFIYLLRLPLVIIITSLFTEIPNDSVAWRLLFRVLRSKSDTYIHIQQLTFVLHLCSRSCCFVHHFRYRRMGYLCRLWLVL